MLETKLRHLTFGMSHSSELPNEVVLYSLLSREANRILLVAATMDLAVLVVRPQHTGQKSCPFLGNIASLLLGSTNQSWKVSATLQSK